MKRTTSWFEGTTFTLDPATNRPLYLQLTAFLRDRILNGDWPAHGRLPSTRALARTLRISRNTVVNAYEALVSEGLIAGAIGSGTRVLPHGRKPRPLDWRRLVRASHYPTNPIPLRDPDGNPLYLHQ